LCLKKPKTMGNVQNNFYRVYENIFLTLWQQALRLMVFVCYAFLQLLQIVSSTTCISLHLSLPTVVFLYAFTDADVIWRVLGQFSSVLPTLKKCIL
jgi:hypothetical protein